jgi:hypothetical protein
MLANDASQKNISHNLNWGLPFGIEFIVSDQSVVASTFIALVAYRWVISSPVNHLWQLYSCESE